MSTKKLTLLALFTTISLAIYAIESAIPPLVPIPGIKLGLANIITLLLLQHFSAKEAALVLIARILLSTLLFGQAMSMMYSFAGGLLSLVLMALILKLLQKEKTYLAGAIGGLAHNLGQLCIAFLITSTGGVLAYLPFLVLSGILTGLFTGLCAGFMGRYLKKILGFSKK